MTHNRCIVPPKISYHVVENLGTIKVIRRSLWCWVIGVKAIAIWNRIYKLNAHDPTANYPMPT